MKTTIKSQSTNTNLDQTFVKTEEYDEEVRDQSLSQHTSQIAASNRYTLITRLGEGGMGVVSAVRDHLLQRDVAHKSLKGQAAPLQRELFIREAQTLAKLNHPNIPPIYDLVVPSAQEEGQGALFFTMEKVNGDTLSTLIRNFHQSEAHQAETLFYRLLEIFISTTKAVDYAHAQDLLHRDLKPDNIMVKEFGDVRVLDWGLSGRTDGKPKSMSKNHTPGFSDPSSTALAETIVSDSITSINLMGDETFIDLSHTAEFEHSKDTVPAQMNFTFTGLISGTPAYMSPEQARGEVLTPQSDIYSLGAILYEILSGYPPLVRENLGRPDLVMTLIHSAQQGICAPKLNPALCPHPQFVSEFLIRVCSRALAPTRSERYQTVANLTSDLYDYLTGQNKRVRIQSLKQEVHQSFQNWYQLKQELLQVQDIWSRFEAISQRAQAAFIFSHMIASLKQLAEIDKSDLDVRVWGLQVNYHYVNFIYREGEINQFSYQNILDNLKKRAQALLIFRNHPLGHGIPWQKIDWLAEQQRQVLFNLNHEFYGKVRCELRRLDKLNHVSEMEHFSKKAPLMTFEQTQECSLNWGYYRLDVFYDEEVDTEVRKHFVKLINIQLPEIPQLSSNHLVQICGQQQPCQISETADIIKIEIKCPPKMPSDSAGWLSSQGQLNEENHHADFNFFDFKWIAQHEVTLGTNRPLALSLPSRQSVVGNFWIQQYPVTIESYQKYLESIARLAQTLPKNEQNLAFEDLDRCIPSNKLPFLEVGKIKLFTQVDATHFELCQVMRERGLTEQSPIGWLSINQVKRYVLWKIWDTGVLWSIPTEDEWELSARGIDQRLFPWGDLNADEVTLNQKSFWQNEFKYSHMKSLAHLTKEYPHDLSPFEIRFQGGVVSDWVMLNQHKEIRRAEKQKWLQSRPDDSSSIIDRAQAFFGSSIWRDTFSEQIELDAKFERTVLRGGSYVNDAMKCHTLYRFETIPFKEYLDAGFRLVYRP